MDILNWKAGIQLSNNHDNFKPEAPCLKGVCMEADLAQNYSNYLFFKFSAITTFMLNFQLTLNYI